MPIVGPLVCPVLVGRDDLLRLADRRIGEAVGGRGELLFLAGEAGIGKSRLLAAFEAKAMATGFAHLRGATFPRDLEVAAAPILDLARSQDGMRLVPGLLDRLLDEPTGVDAHRRRRLLVLDVADLLARASTDRPLIVTLEDLHWADDLTLEIVAALGRKLSTLPMLVVATYRSDELYPRVPMRDWRARLITQRLAEEARLPRLDVGAVATMTTLLLGSGLPAAQDVVEAVYARTDGIPLHVEELLGVVVGAAGERGRTILAADVPDTLDDAVRERLARRSAAARRAARAASVIGRSFDLDMLAAVIGLRAERVAAATSELADHFILVPALQSGRFDFRHALIRDAIYASVPAPERRRLHARVADVAAAGRADEGFLSIHLEAAGRPDEAFAAAVAAARRATALSSRNEALELYRRALRNRPPSLPTEEHARLLEEHATAAAAADDNEAAAASFLDARRRYLEAGLPADAARVLAPHVAARHLLGDSLDARAALLRAGLEELDAVPRSRDVLIARTRLLAALCAAYMLDRRLDESLEYGEAARSLAAEIGDESAEFDTLATVGSDLVFAGRMDEGWAMLEDAVGRARATQREAEAARAFRMIGSCASVLVEYDRGEQWLREGIEYAERVELWNHRHYMAAHLGHVLWATGRWDEGERIAAHALADGRGGITTRITALHVLGYVALSRGDLEPARAHLDEARHLGETMGELQRLSPALWGLAEAAVLAGDFDEAVESSERGLAASSAVRDAAYLFPFLVTGTRARLAAGDPAGAERWVARVGDALRDRAIPGTLPALDHAAGLVALARGTTGQARALLAAASKGWRGRRRTWEGTWSLIDLAAAEARSNRLASASSAATEAADAARALGSQPLLSRALDVLRQVRARHPADEPWAPLTAREYEVSRHIAAGRTNAEIAAEIGVSPKTVSAHVEHILAKLGVNRRAEVAAWAATVSTRTGEVAEAR